VTDENRFVSGVNAMYLRVCCKLVFTINYKKYKQEYVMWL